MTRFLAILMIVVLVFAHGSSVAASVCHHQDAHAHAIARESRDPSVAAVPLAEEAAAAVESKKASQSAGTGMHWPVEMLPAVLPVVPYRVAEPVRLRPADQAALASTSVRPLLEPPSA